MYYVSSLLMVCFATTVNVITLNVHRNGAANQDRQVPIWMQRYILGYLATLMPMTIHEPDSITLLKTCQTKKSTIRRSSLFRDLKKIRNYTKEEASPTIFRRQDTCECMAQQDSDHRNHLRMVNSAPTFMQMDDLTTTSMANHEIHQPLIHNGAPPVKRKSNRDANNIAESAFMVQIVREQLVPRMLTNRPVMLADFEDRFRKILRRVYRTLQRHEIREEGDLQLERGLQLFDGCFYRDGAMERLLEKQNADDKEATTNVEAHDNLFEVGNNVGCDSDASVEFL